MQLTSRCLADGFLFASKKEMGRTKKRGRFETEPRSGDEILLTVMDREDMRAHNLDVSTSQVLNP